MTTEDLIASIFGDIRAAVPGSAVHLHLAPEGQAPPYVTFSVISDTPDHTHGGELGGSLRIQIDTYATSAETAAALRDSINFHLATRRPSFDGELFGVYLRTSSFSAFEDETKLYRQSTDFNLHL